MKIVNLNQEFINQQQDNSLCVRYIGCFSELNDVVWLEDSDTILLQEGHSMEYSVFVDDIPLMIEALTLMKSHLESVGLLKKESND